MTSKYIEFVSVSQDSDSLFENITLNSEINILPEFTCTFNEKINNNNYYGSFSYEESSTFGDIIVTEGEILYNTEYNLLGFIRTSMKPKTESIIRYLNDSPNLHLKAPEYEQEAITDFYRTYSFNGYTVSFRTDIADYTFDSNYQYVKPEETAKERAMMSKSIQMSDDLVNKVAEEFIKKGYFISSMDITLHKNGPQVGFSTPLRISRIKKNELNKENILLIVERVKEILDNNVKSIEEVCSET